MPLHFVDLPETIKERVELGGWALCAEWTRDLDSEAPIRVTIEPTDRLTPEARQRGITSGVLRRFEGELAKMAADLERSLAIDELQAEAQARIQALPGDPRTTPDQYYPALLDLFEWSKGVMVAPLAGLAQEMGLKRSTLNSRLRIARDRARGQ